MGSQWQARCQSGTRLLSGSHDYPFGRCDHHSSVYLQCRGRRQNRGRRCTRGHIALLVEYSLARKPRCSGAGTRTQSRSDQAFVRDAPSPRAEERSNGRSKTRTMSPPRAVARHRAICAGPARCEHRRKQRGSGLAFLVTFLGNAKK